ncbi:phospholipid/cholesterol/gamma-HCH transport system ATP-binding protein [Actinocorallia herbida]|uniref:Phospholipid/cholesterol/gamma-HCH transport system ATP-binding protein n=1 Tax=Actinocorallia herbida TaxID=58109 RepID=A0A3N1D5R1_9ACTN|nr:ABC transporter ATP-binding protein [Actinocorallia herbida]ROO88882.1 phospholipid/cholesterol/gamma-HCH transport system ATP-binding protein [Actinocorallia herbida]
MGVEIRVEGLRKSFGRQVIWEDVSFTVPAGQISALLGPSGTGKSVFLKNLIGLLRPDRGHVWVDGQDVPELRERRLYEMRRRFGVLFQDGALFGSMSVFDNVAFPLREHTRLSESKVRAKTLEKMEMVGLSGAEDKFPGEISGGMRKRAGLARALVLDPEIILADEPDSGLDPVRTSYLSQLFVDINHETGATILIVTHDIGTARVLPDNMGLLFRRGLVAFGPREMILTSRDPAVNQFFNARREGPIGMAEEKDLADQSLETYHDPAPAPIPPQIMPSDGRPRRNQTPPGTWLRAHGLQPPPGSFIDAEGRNWQQDWPRLTA